MCNLKNKSDDKIIDLFWSGGWDSTFRLLQILLVEKMRVQPHYMVWSGDTVGETVKAMHKIRKQLYTNYPETKKLLLPINYFDSEAIKPNKKISKAFNKLEESNRVGAQHKMLALFCEKNNYYNAEQGTEKDSHSHQLIKEYLTDYRIDKEKAPKLYYDLFKYFKFPLIEWTKKEMDDFAIEHGWDDIMYLTWFCRRPKKGRPCGFCGNCTDTLIHGMGKRLPLRARIIAYIQLPFRKWWRNNYKKRSTGVFKHIKNLLKHKA